jgi:hypothetical protein
MLNAVNERLFQLRETIFEKKFANCLLARDGKKVEKGEVIGMALVGTSRCRPQNRGSTWIDGGARAVLFQLLYVARSSWSLRGYKPVPRDSTYPG